MADTTTKKLYSLEEVSKYDGSNGSRVWIVVSDKVYDVTDVIDEHPGGGELVTEYAGKDATRAFNDFGHSAEALSDMKKLLIGELIEEDKKANRRKKNQPVQSTEKVPTHRSFLSIISCGICS